MDDEFQCSYCHMATEDLQKCVTHVITNHGGKCKKIRTLPLNEKTGKFGWMSKDFGFIPNDHITPEQYAVVNREDWE